MLRGGSGTRVHHEVSNFGVLGNTMDDICRAANSLAPLTEELGNQPRANTRPFRHGVLSLAPGEELDDSEMCRISRQVVDGLVKKYATVPTQPTVIAVHRDTDKLHTHILTVPVDVVTGKRIHLPKSVKAYRNILDPLEEKLGLQSPQTGLGWNDYRFHLPFATWVAMEQSRLQETRDAVLHSNNWRESMDKLAKWGIGYRETSANFAATTRYFLSPFHARRRDKGMSIQRELLRHIPKPPTAAECVSKWGTYPKDYQERLVRQSKPLAKYSLRPIGGQRGELAYRRWEGYAKHQRGAEASMLLQFEEALERLQHAPKSHLSMEDRRTLNDPQHARKRMVQAAKPMKFSHWVEYMADKGDKDCQWLAGWGDRGANVDPELASEAEREGDLESQREADSSAAAKCEQLAILRREELRFMQEQQVARKKLAKERQQRKRERLQKQLMRKWRVGNPPGAALLDDVDTRDGEVDDHHDSPSI